MPIAGMDNGKWSRAAARDLTRLLQADQQSRILDVGCGQGQLVAQLRQRGLLAFGLFDGPPPSQESRDGDDIPAIQPASLQNSIPFLAQSFDGVLLRHSDSYQHPLHSPEAFTATANLLACLKPGCSLLVTARLPAAELQQHLGGFPGELTQLTLGHGGLLGGLLRSLRLSWSRPVTAFRFRIPTEPISRKAWHRLALQAVRSGQSAQRGHIPQPHVPLTGASSRRTRQRV